MTIVFSDRAIEALADAPAAVQRAFHKQLRFLEANLQHPSLRAKKYDEANNIWQARINRNWRCYFITEGDRYIITNVTPHPK